MAAKVLRARAQSTAAPPREKTPAVTTQAREQARVLAQQRHSAKRSISSGTRGFARGFWKPFAHAVRALWHEVTGLFFGIFALFFAGGLYRVRHAWRFGPEHRHFVFYLVVTLLFAYFSVSSFVSSRRSPH